MSFVVLPLGSSQYRVYSCVASTEHSSLMRKIGWVKMVRGVRCPATPAYQEFNTDHVAGALSTEGNPGGGLAHFVSEYLYFFATTRSGF